MSTIEEATQWFLRLQDDAVDEQTFIDWQQWLAASPENRAAYDQVEEMMLRLRQAPARPALPSAQELARDTYDGSVPISEWKAQRARPRTRPVIRLRAALAAMALIASLLIAGLWVNQARKPEVGAFTYRTEPGGREAVTLPDGSRVTLDADSLLEARFSPQRRSLQLVRGEAFFQVMKDRTRPFVVQAGSTVVTALGTAFNVRRSENRTVVAVTEGTVEVVAAPDAPRLTAQVAAGEAVSYRDDGNLQSISAAEAHLATSWLEGRRQYRNEPLRYVLADVDRYTGREIEVADKATGDLRFTGTLNLENSEGWLRALSIALPVKISTREDGTLSVTAVDPREHF